MKTVGIIGGIGPESTIEYYRGILASYRRRRPDGSSPSIILNSVSVQKLLALMDKDDLPGVIDYLVPEINRLAAAGADFGLIAANTPHIVFDEIQQQSPIPLLSIVEATCAEAKARGIQRAGLLGTRFTMQADFYPAVFSREGIALVVPATDQQAYIHDKYVNELLKDIFLPSTRERLWEIIQTMKERQQIEAVVLAGTELPLILHQDEAAGLPLLDTTQIHVEATVARLLS
ncbi:MAG: amino acid racemase [Candidatus Korobacteraceae bacterium]